jgi:hypothetical protein
MTKNSVALAKSAGIAPARFSSMTSNEIANQQPACAPRASREIDLHEMVIVFMPT